MNRRGFLKLFSAALPTAVIAPKYFFSPVGGWKSDVIQSPYTTYLLPPSEILKVYYDKRFLETLKYQIPQSLLGRTVPPLVKGDFRRGCYFPEPAVHFLENKL